jgi:ABC-2 type transport system permease protein
VKAFMKTFWMLIRREFWEHRTLWVTPLIVAALILIGVAAQDEWHAVVRPDLPPRPDGLAGAQPYEFGVLNLDALFFVAAALVAVAYLMDCLYTERRDRSILFWRSLPVSDSAVVLAKFTVATVCVPLLFYVAAVVTSLIGGQILRMRGDLLALGLGSPGSDWLDVLRLQALVLYGVVATVLWYTPYAAYLMLISAWARRSVLAWAVTPPLLAALIERVLFDTTVIGRVVQRGFNEIYRLAFRINQEVNVTLGDMLQPMRRGGGPGGGGGGRGGGGGGMAMRFDPTELLSSPQLWLGLAAAALLLWGAIALRRRSREA